MFIKFVKDVRQFLVHPGYAAMDGTVHPPVLCDFTKGQVSGLLRGRALEQIRLGNAVEATDDDLNAPGSAPAPTPKSSSLFGKASA
jgi:hypothetical protein